MQTEEIVNGLKQLGFNSGWVVNGNEITLWENESPQPTMQEISVASKLWEENQIKAKKAVEAKLEALGLTVEDLRILGLG